MSHTDAFLVGCRSVESDEDISLEGWTSCNTFTKWTSSVCTFRVTRSRWPQTLTPDPPRCLGTFQGHRRRQRRLLDELEAARRRTQRLAGKHVQRV